MTGQMGFWSIAERLAEISARGDPLETLAATVDFEMFRPVLVRVLGERPRWRGGRPGFDPVLKFRMLVLQSLHGLSLEATEYLVRDRLSWMRFCRLGPGDAVPDANTLWDFREALIRAGALDDLFARLDQAITAAGYLPRGGQIVDATLVAAPRQRLTDGEKAQIKEGRTAAEVWPDEPAKARQKDVDGRWTLQRSKGKARPDGTEPITLAAPAVRLQVARLHRPHARDHPPPDHHRRRPARRRAPARGAGSEGQHRPRRLGRQRLSLSRERGVAGRERYGQPHPSQEAAGGDRCPSAPAAPTPRSRRHVPGSSTSSPSRRRA